MNDIQKLVMLLAGTYAGYKLLEIMRDESNNKREQEKQPPRYTLPPYTSAASPGISFWDAAGVRTPLAFRGQDAMVGSGIDAGNVDMNLQPLFNWFGDLFDSDQKSKQKDYYNQGQVMNESNEYRPLPSSTPKASFSPSSKPVNKTIPIPPPFSNSAQFSNAALPRGIRNNNPGNIRHGDAWQGRRDQQTDSAFVQFVSPAYGIRAMVKVLQTYQDDYGINTIEDIISRWAPSIENDTESYIRSVVKKTGVSRDAPINIGQNEFTHKLVKAIIFHENGTQPYNVAVIRDGVALAV